MKELEAKLTVEQKRLRKKYTRAYYAYSNNMWAELVIENQSFIVAKNCTKKEIEWFRDRLAIALARLLEIEKEKRNSPVNAG